jgi:hypothetical protein
MTRTCAQSAPASRARQARRTGTRAAVLAAALPGSALLRAGHFLAAHVVRRHRQASRRSRRAAASLGGWHPPLPPPPSLPY